MIEQWSHSNGISRDINFKHLSGLSVWRYTGLSWPRTAVFPHNHSCLKTVIPPPDTPCKAGAETCSSPPILPKVHVLSYRRTVHSLPFFCLRETDCVRKIKYVNHFPRIRMFLTSYTVLLISDDPHLFAYTYAKDLYVWWCIQRSNKKCIDWKQL